MGTVRIYCVDIILLVSYMVCPKITTHGDARHLVGVTGVFVFDPRLLYHSFSLIGICTGDFLRECTVLERVDYGRRSERVFTPEVTD